MLDLGDPWPDLSVQVTDLNGAAADATTVKLTITAPDATVPVNAVTVASSAPGVYSYDFIPTLAGRWTARWVATGTNASVYGDTVDVFDGSAALMSLADAREHLGIDVGDTADDEEIRGYLLAASEWVQGKTAAIAAVTAVEVHAPYRGGFLYLDNPCLSLTSISGVYGNTATYDAAAVTAASPELSIGKLWLGCGWADGDLQVTYRAGLALVPASVLLATKMFVKTLWDTQRGAGQSPLDAEVGDVAADGGMGLAVWRAEQLLQRYERAGVVA